MKVKNMVVYKVVLLLIPIFSMLPLPLDAFCGTQTLPVGQVQKFVVKDSEGNECDNPEILNTFATLEEPGPDSCEGGIEDIFTFATDKEFYVGMCVRNNCDGPITVKALFQYSGKRGHGRDSWKEKIKGREIISIYVKTSLTKKGHYTYKMIIMSKSGRRVAKKSIKLVLKPNSEQSGTPTASPTGIPTALPTATATVLPTVTRTATPTVTATPMVTATTSPVSTPVDSVSPTTTETP